MTPSEKKAREDIVSEIIQESNRYEDGFISSDQFLGFLNEALDAAEFRGYERGMVVATKIIQDSLRKGLTHDEA